MGATQLGGEVAVQAATRLTPAGHGIGHAHIDMDPATGSALHTGAGEDRIAVKQRHPVVFQLLNAAVVLGVEVDRHHVRGRDDRQPQLLAQLFGNGDPLQKLLAARQPGVTNGAGSAIRLPTGGVLAHEGRHRLTVLEHRLPAARVLVFLALRMQLSWQSHWDDGLQLQAKLCERTDFCAQGFVIGEIDHRCLHRRICLP